MYKRYVRLAIYTDSLTLSIHIILLRIWCTAIFNKNFCFFYVETAKIIRIDKCNENLNVAAIRKYFRRHDNDSLAGKKRFTYTVNLFQTRYNAVCL